MMEVSVIVPVYNAKKYLGQCIESILHQTFKSFELILVDDGSEDGSGKLCDSYQTGHSNVKVIHKENAGLGHSRNSGIDVSVGKYIVFVDADDYLDGDFLQSLYEAVDKNNADCAVAGYNVVYSDNQVLAQPCVKKEKLFTGEEIKELLLGSFGAMPDSKRDVPYGQSVWSRMYRRQTLIENQIRFVSEKKYISEDLVFNLDFLRYAKRAVAIPYTSYYYNCTNVGSLSKIHRSDRAAMDIQLKKYMEEKLEEIFEHKEYILYLQRSLLMRVAFDIEQEVLYHDHKDKSYSMRASVKKILAEDEMRKVLCEYPWWKLPFQRKILVATMRFQMADLLILGIRVKHRFGRNCQNI